ncbi:hypothetical protein IPA_09070 [Ignicoccus pacificus DSM 13166]|uniref:Uncharacterized protein n=1 Tax=Ignicoccus pacificus DSM 13166 TaxID=940294 RepID=A0A977KC35_9CREN|nr:hypothetical protein IPA_09070 [Ignicoccus pacificus DSM 13166]
MRKYGRKKGYELEKKSLKMLKMDQFKKKEWIRTSHR